MQPFYEEQMATIYYSDALKALKELLSESVQMCMTSPPYWGLRNYAGGTDIVWGGDENCKHAWRGQLGLEPTPELYVEHLMMIFREVKRVLRKDGSFYLNIGDTYFSNPSNQQGHGFGKSRAGARAAFENLGRQKRIFTNGILKPKCMVCIPERVMFSMIEDGWILNNKIIWHKPNAMPGSQKGRLTTSWEYLYFFTKNSKTILWRNRQTGEWRDKRPTKEENYPWGGIYQHIETGEFRWDKPPAEEIKLWKKYQPLWMGFDYYFELDSIRIPHSSQSLERYQREVNLDRPAIGKSAEVGPMQQYKRAPQWFQTMFPEDQDYKGKFDLFGHGPNPQSFNLRIRDVKRGKKGVSAQGGELKASQKEIEEYEYPEKHHGSSMINQAALHRDRRLTKHGQAVGRTGNVSYTDPLHTKDYSPKGKNPGDVLIAHQESPHRERQKHESADLGAQSPARKRHSGYFGEDGQPLVDLAKGKNPGDYWDITTQPSSICVCPKCDAVFSRYIKVCPSCGIEGVVGHFAPYPVALCEIPIKASTRLGDVVLDPLAGGGNTGVAAKRLGRRCILIDCVKEYCVMAKYKLSRIEFQPELIPSHQNVE